MPDARLLIDGLPFRSRGWAFLHRRNLESHGPLLALGILVPIEAVVHLDSSLEIVNAWQEQLLPAPEHLPEGLKVLCRFNGDEQICAAMAAQNGLPSVLVFLQGLATGNPTFVDLSSILDGIIVLWED